MTSSILCRLPSILALCALLCTGLGCAEGWGPELRNSGAADTVPAYTEEGPLDWSSNESDGDEAPGGTEDGLDSSDDSAAEAEAGLIALEPAPDSTTHHYRAPLLVTFDADATGATVTLFGPTAAAPDHVIPTEARWNELNTAVTVQPGEFLLPSTTYTVTLDVGDARLDYSFTTTSVGGPMDEGVLLGGRTYALSLQDAEVTAPAGLATFVAQLPSGLVWLWGIEAGDYPDELDIDVSLGEDADAGLVQDQCADVRPLGGSGASIDLQSSYFSSSTGDFELLLGSQFLVLEQGSIDGDFVADGTSVVEVGVRGWLRADDLAGLVPSGHESCDWLASELDASCHVCPSGSGQCIWMELRELAGSETSLSLADLEDDAAAGADDDDEDTVDESDDDTGATSDPDGSADDDDAPPTDEDCGEPDYDPFACSMGLQTRPSGTLFLLLVVCGALSGRRRLAVSSS